MSLVWDEIQEKGSESHPFMAWEPIVSPQGRLENYVRIMFEAEAPTPFINAWGRHVYRMLVQNFTGGPCDEIPLEGELRWLSGGPRMWASVKWSMQKAGLDILRGQLAVIVRIGSGFETEYLVYFTGVTGWPNGWTLAEDYYCQGQMKY